jgi:serine/threonine protein kinase
MGVSCCKEVKIETKNKIRVIADGERSISWIRGNKIGSGSFGTVYLAIDTENASMFAVKSISLMKNKDTLSKFFDNIREEVRVLKTLDHTNVIKYYQTDIDLERNEVNILTEYASGGSLQSFILQFKYLPEKCIQKLTKDIINALIYLHNKGIVHRDLKCANILLTESSTVKLSDFGLSKCIDRHYKGTEIAGSPYWMAPEILLQSGYSFSADIWSLGCVVIEMLTGQPPWYSSIKTTKDLIKTIKVPSSFPAIPACSKELKNFLDQCLNKNPDLRPGAQDLLTHEFITNDFSSGGATHNITDI